MNDVPPRTASADMPDPSDMPAPDFSAPDVIADPYPLLAALRRDDPVHWNAGLGGWCLTRYDDVRRAFLDKRLSSEWVRPLLNQADMDEDARSELIRMFGSWLMFLDPPDHARLRRLVVQGFTSRAIRRLRGQVTRIAHELVDAIIARNAGQPRGRFDLIEEFADPLPLAVLAHILGVPAADIPDLKRWSAEGAKRGLGDYIHMAANIRAMRGYFAGLLAGRRANPGGAIIDDLIAARDGADRLSDDELIATCAMLLFAGYETAMRMFGNGALALLRHPDQLADLVAHLDVAALVENMVEEILRYDGPTIRMGRMAMQAIELHGKVIKPGQRVFIFPGAAGRDPEIFPDPDRLDIHRHNAYQHISFGFGIHLCPAAQLARLEGQEGFPVLFSRLADLRLESAQLEWNRTMIVRGVAALPVSFRNPDP